ncbi:transmembrane protein [Methylophaga lonarensis MPL]|uniref:Transmembrane protein n=1 Tax=Methylophaga lonarensis MPL TaxID=1286106 RepID=M7PRY7_9GAMM|nr:DUF2818 family protein [Methylophaga lonarensis]EMR13194.1 transmembrane protein [Methylophaga lonarensis MPL]
MSVAALLLLWFVLASLPWVNERTFVVIKVNTPKSAWIRLGEVVVYYFVALMVAAGFEQRFSGNIYQQDWEFFVTTLCLFLVLAVPAVVYRHQWLPEQQKQR